MTAAGPSRPRRSVTPQDAGVALLSVVAVLIVLVLVATVFVVTMRDSQARGERFLYSARADAEAESLFGLVRAQLVRSLESVEYRRLKDLGDEDPDERTAPLGATPTSDRLAEFQLPREVTDRFNRLTSHRQRVWSVDVFDQQGLLDLNGCSYPVLANILGRTELARNLSGDETRVLLRDGSAFPEDGGVIRIGSEAIWYEQRHGDELVGCRRGYRSDLPENSSPEDWQEGDTVVSEAAFQIASRPYRVRPGTFARYTHPYQARSISEFGVTALPPERFDVLRQHVTAWGGDTAGDGWSNPQNVENDVSASDYGARLVTVGNVRYFGPGTVVKITDGVNADFGTVMKVVGTDQVLIAGSVENDYEPGQARIYSRARTPLNVNTAPFDTLVHALHGLRLRGRTRGVDRRRAVALASFLREWTAEDREEEPGVFLDWKEFVSALEEAQAEKVLGQEEFTAVLRNAMNANDSRLAFSTVPFVFRSYDLYEVRATASLLDGSGRELARRELRRLLSASSARSEVVVLESQDDFQRQIMRSRDSKWFATWPDNVNAHYDAGNVPASEYRPFALLERFPSDSRLPGVGDVRLLPSRFSFENQDEDRVFHFDDSDLHEGVDLTEDPVTVGVAGPYDTDARDADLVHHVTIEGVPDDIEAGLRPFPLSFLYRPDWSRGDADQVIFDYGLEHPDVNRVSLRYDRQRDMLVLAVADATLEARSIEVFYDFDPGGWEEGQWYHIGVSVGGCSPELVELFVDGEKVGRATGITRLTGFVPGDSDVLSLSVEDATTFPDYGVLYVQSEFGAELIEYESRSDRAFIVHRRKARSLDKVDAGLDFRPHPEGSVVQLYGFAAPLWTDVRRGGARLTSAIGPQRLYRMAYRGDTVDSLVMEEDPATGEMVPKIDTYAGLVHLPDYEPTITLVEWDTASREEDILNDLGEVGAEGFALMIAPVATIPDDDGKLEVTGKNADTGGAQGGFNQGGSGGGGGGFNAGGGTGGGAGAMETQEVVVGGVDIVHYRVVEIDPDEGVKVTLLDRGMQLRYFGTDRWMNPAAAGAGRFFPGYNYGDDPANPTAPDTVVLRPDSTGSGPSGAITGGGGGTLPPLPGMWTAFIPITVAGRGTAPDYLDPSGEEPQLEEEGDYHAYVQIDSEWVKYDAVDTTTVPDTTLFYRGLPITDLWDEFFYNVENTVDSRQWQVNPSFRNPGGTGGTTTGSLEPPRALDGNTETDLPPEPQPPAGSSTGGSTGGVAGGIGSGGSTGGGATGGGGFNSGSGGGASSSPTFQPPPYTAFEILEAMDYRGYERASRNETFRIANTIPREHAASEPIRVTFKVRPGNDIETGPAARGAFPGFNDLITLRDYDGRDEQVRVQWGYKGWCGLTDDSIQSWGWNRLNYENLMGRHDSRIFTRALKFPSGEMPDSELTKSEPEFRFGTSFDGETQSPAMMDEMVFPEIEHPNDRPDYALLGEVPFEFRQLVVPASAGINLPRFQGIDAKQTDIKIHMGHHRDLAQQVLVSGYDVSDLIYREDGGVVRIDDELVFYGEVDLSEGVLRDCQRGVFDTEAAAHAYGARVVPVETFAATRLESNVNASAAYYQLADSTDFPDAGYLRIADGLEILGYTENDEGSLWGPLGRIDPTTTRDDDPDVDARVGGALFRGRFATEPGTYSPGDIVISMPFRVWDRYADYSDDPENSYTQFSWTRPGAIWKRVTWDERPEEFVEVLALLRFAGGPEWDSTDVIRVGQEQMPPAADRRLYLYEISDPGAQNLLNVQADRLEVRLVVRFDQGAYDRFSPDRPDHWKNTPWIEQVKVEFVAPPLVLYQE